MKGRSGWVCPLFFTNSLSLEVRKAFEGDVEGDFLRSAPTFARVVAPRSFREADPARGARRHHGGDEVTVAQHELVFTIEETGVREGVFHAADDGFTRPGGLLRQLEDVRAHPFVQVRHVAANGQMLFIEDAPRGNGELHHRHQGVDLAGADDELLVDVRRRDAEERRELPAANHVWTGIRMPQEAGGRHARNEHLHSVPRIILIAQALHQRLAAELEALVDVAAEDRHRPHADRHREKRLPHGGVRGVAEREQV